MAGLWQATLEEVVEADLLLHVIDGSSEQMLVQREAVLAVLRRLGVSEARLQNGVIEVVNKSDVFSGDPSAAALPDDGCSGSQSPDSSNADEAFGEVGTAGTSVLQAEGVPSTAGTAEAPGAGSAEAQCSVTNEPKSSLLEAARTAGSNVDGSGRQESSASEEVPLHRSEGISTTCEWEGTQGGSGQDQGCHVSATLEWVRGRAGRQSSVVVTSAVTGDGLDDLLLEIDKKVGQRVLLDLWHRFGQRENFAQNLYIRFDSLAAPDQEAPLPSSRVVHAVASHTNVLTRDCLLSKLKCISLLHDIIIIIIIIIFIIIIIILSLSLHAYPSHCWLRCVAAAFL